MKLYKLYSPTYEEWPEIEQRGFASYCMNITVPTFLIMVSAVVAFYLYGILMLQTPYFAGYETAFATAMREIDLTYILPKILYFSAGGLVFSLFVNMTFWFSSKELYKKGEAAWKAKKEPNKMIKWMHRNGLAFYVALAFIILGSNYGKIIKDAKLPATSIIDLFIGALAFITPGILFGALVAQQNAMNMPRKFNLEEKKITVWPYSIPFLITLCLLVAAALGHPI